MDSSKQLFIYCERGADPGFWAEPLNALSNAAFIVAAGAASAIYVRRQRRDGAALALIGLVFAIGAGSFLFHTFATRWAAFADTAPIGVFMIAYLGYALRRFAAASCPISLAIAAGFVACLWLAAGITCSPDLLPVTAAAGRTCLNGSAAYVPAWGAMVMLAAFLAFKQHAAGRLIAAAAATFAVSALLRTVDIEVCASTRISSRTIGTHFLWHLLNAVTLFMLLKAAIEDGLPHPVAVLQASRHKGVAAADVVEPVDTQDLKS